MKTLLVLVFLLTQTYGDQLSNMIKVTKLIKSNKAFSSKQISEFAKVLEETKGTKKR